MASQQAYPTPSGSSQQAYPVADVVTPQAGFVGVLGTDTPLPSDVEYVDVGTTGFNSFLDPTVP